jgi:xylulokinase
MSLLAVDIGTSACKAMAFSASGEVLAEHATRVAPTFPRPSFAEVAADKFWDAICASCRAVSANVREPVRALCLSSHGETFVAVDSHGRPVRSAILNQDGRATKEAAWCEEIIGRRRLFDITGLFSHAMYPIPKILWLRQHEPEVFASTKAFLSLIGYILLKMALPPYVDYSLASRFLAFDIRQRCWSDEILQATDLCAEYFPEPRPAGTVVGKLSSKIATELGVPDGTPVVLGGHDQPCGALGAGVIGPDRICDSIGTYECLLAVSDEPSLTDKALNASLNSYCHVVPEKFVSLAYFPSGIMVQWFHDLLYADCLSETAPVTFTPDTEASHYAFLEAHAPKGPTGLCVMPHLIGSCNPEFNPHARGVIFGLDPATGRSHIYKGILEGLACELSLLSELLAGAVGGFDDIYVTGGGTRSALGLQLRSALTGRRLHVLGRQETVCMGTAMLAGLAIGEYASIPQAVEALVRESLTVVPDPAVAESYRNQLQRYRQMRTAVVQQW